MKLCQTGVPASSSRDRQRSIASGTGVGTADRLLRRAGRSRCRLRTRFARSALRIARPPSPRGPRTAKLVDRLDRQRGNATHGRDRSRRPRARRPPELRSASSSDVGRRQFAASEARPEQLERAPDARCGRSRLERSCARPRRATRSARATSPENLPAMPERTLELDLAGRRPEAGDRARRADRSRRARRRVSTRAMPAAPSRPTRLLPQLPGRRSLAERRLLQVVADDLVELWPAPSSERATASCSCGARRLGDTGVDRVADQRVMEPKAVFVRAPTRARHARAGAARAPSARCPTAARSSSGDAASTVERQKCRPDD